MKFIWPPRKHRNTLTRTYYHYHTHSHSSTHSTTHSAEAHALRDRLLAMASPTSLPSPPLDSVYDEWKPSDVGGQNSSPDYPPFPWSPARALPDANNDM